VLRACDRFAAAVVTLPTPGDYLCGLTWDGKYLWHSDQDALAIYALDRADGSVVRQFACPFVRADLAFDGVRLCQVGGRPKRLVVVDRDTGEITGTRPIAPASGRVTGAEFGPEGLWLVLRSPTVIQLRDYPEMSVRRELSVPGSSPSGLTYADGVVVYGDFESQMLHAVDAITERYLAATRVDGRPTGLTWDGEHVWYCDFLGRAARAIELADLLI
jgi:hypothetical protein